MATAEAPTNVTKNANAISVVDDDSSVRHAIASLMRSVGIHVQCFASAESYLESGLVPKTRCLILDVRMRGMSGLELQALLAVNGDQVPIVFISAHADAESRTRAMEAGAVGFLWKPFSEGDLLACVETALASRG